MVDFDWTPSRTVLLLYAFTILGSLLAYLSKAIYSRLLPQESYGLLYSLLGFFIILTNVSGFGFLGSQQYYGIKYYTRDDARLGNVFWYTVLVEALSSLLFIGLIYVFLDGLAISYFGDSRAAQLLLILGVYFLFRNLTTVLKRQFLVKEDYARKGAAEPLAYLFILIGTGLLVLFDAVTVISVAYVWLASFFLVTCIYAVLSFSWFPKALPQLPTWDSELFGKMTRYGIPAMLGAGGFTLLARIDTQIVTVLIGLSSAAVYEISLSVASIQTLLSTPLGQFHGPRLQTAIERGNTATAQHLLTTITRALYALLGCFVVAAILNAEILARLLFSAKYAEAAPYVQLLSFAFFFQGVSNVLLSSLNSFGLPKQRMIVVYIAAAVNLVGSAIGAVFFDMIGVAAVSTAVFAVLLISAGVSIDWYTELDSPWWYMSIGSAAVLAWSGISYAASPFVGNIWESIPVTLGLLTGFVSSLFLVRLITPQMLRDLVKDIVGH